MKTTIPLSLQDRRTVALTRKTMSFRERKRQRPRHVERETVPTTSCRERTHRRSKPEEASEHRVRDTSGVYPFFLDSHKASPRFYHVTIVRLEKTPSRIR